LGEANKNAPKLPFALGSWVGRMWLIPNPANPAANRHSKVGDVWGQCWEGLLDNRRLNSGDWYTTLTY